MQGGIALTVLLAVAGSPQFDRFQAVGRGIIGGAVTGVILRFRIRALADQKLGGFHFFITDCTHQRRNALIVAHLRRTAFQQQAHDFPVSHRGRLMQRRNAVIIRQRRVRAPL